MCAAARSTTTVAAPCLRCGDSRLTPLPRPHDAPPCPRNPNELTTRESELRSHPCHLGTPRPARLAGGQRGHNAGVPTTQRGWCQRGVAHGSRGSGAHTPRVSDVRRQLAARRAVGPRLTLWRAVARIDSFRCASRHFWDTWCAFSGRIGRSSTGTGRPAAFTASWEEAWTKTQQTSGIVNGTHNGDSSSLEWFHPSYRLWCCKQRDRREVLAFTAV